MKCPHGKKCEKCIFYLDWYTTDSEGKVSSTKQCTTISQTILLSDISKKLDRVQKAIESLRNTELGNASLMGTLLGKIVHKQEEIKCEKSKTLSSIS